MPAEARPMTIEDVEIVASLWEAYVKRSVLKLDFSRRITENNVAAMIGDRRVLCAVAEHEGAVVGFLHARVDYWVMNDQPFLNEVAFYTTEGENGAAGLALLRWMHSELEARGIKQAMVAFYGGVEEEKTRAVLTGMGYTSLGGVMSRGIDTWLAEAEQP